MHYEASESTADTRAVTGMVTTRPTIAARRIQASSAQAQDTTTQHLQQQLTSSRRGTLYFAFGSNLSTTQMQQRCPASATPLAIAKLSSYSWFICDRGYANVIAVPPVDDPTLETDATTVWGIIYLLTKPDEDSLDTYEGFSVKESGGPNPNVDERVSKPYLQGDCSYNKLYLLIEVEKWLCGNPKERQWASKQGWMDEWGIKIDGISKDGRKLIRTLIYVDEVRTRPGRIMSEYIPRMSRAVKESVPLGISETWVSNMMRQHGIVWWLGDSAGNRSAAGRDFTDRSTQDGESWEARRERVLRSDGDTLGTAGAMNINDYQLVTEPS